MAKLGDPYYLDKTMYYRYSRECGVYNGNLAAYDTCTAPSAC